MYLHVYPPTPNHTPLSPYTPSGSSYIGSDLSDSPSSAGPMKAKAKISTRKSSENLLEDKPVSPPVPMRASSLEDIHAYSTGTGQTSALRIVDAVVKLYVPDHSHKYLDISPVSGGGVDSCIVHCGCVCACVRACMCTCCVCVRYAHVHTHVHPIVTRCTRECTCT